MTTTAATGTPVSVMDWHKCHSCGGKFFWNLGNGLIQVKDVDKNRNAFALAEGKRHTTECKCGSKNTVTVTRIDGELTLVIV